MQIAEFIANGLVWLGQDNNYLLILIGFALITLITGIWRLK